MNLQHLFHTDLENFVLIASLGGIGQAARKSGQDAGNLSRFLARLERSIGESLFSRHKGGLELTAAGKTLLNAVEQSKAAFERALETTRSRRIRIGMAPAVGFSYFTQGYFAALRNLELVPQFTLRPSVDLFELLKKRELDLVIAPRSLTFPGLIAKSVTTEQLVLCSRSGQQDTLLVHPQLFELERILKGLPFKEQIFIDDYLLLGKFLTEDKFSMGILPKELLAFFPKLEVLKTFKQFGKITILTWPGSVGVEFLKGLRTSPK